MIDYVNDPQWGKVVSRFIKSEMAIKDMKYKDLQKGLAKLGTHQTDSNLRQKVNRGQFSAQLFLQLLVVLDIQHLEIAKIKQIVRHLQSQ